VCDRWIATGSMRIADRALRARKILRLTVADTAECVRGGAQFIR
jgi:hypothetical protein